MRTRTILFALLTVSMTMRSASGGYREAIRADSPSVYWTFESLGREIVRDEAGTTSGRMLATAVGQPGVSGLAGAFDLAHPRGRFESKLTPQEDAVFESILNSTFTVEMWFRDFAPVSDGRRNSSLFYKADREQFTRNSIWFYRARQAGHYHFRIQGRTGTSYGVTIPNPSGDKAAGDGKWHYAAIRVDRSQEDGVLSAFVDGRLVNTSQFPSALRIDNTGPLQIGNNVHLSAPWSGLIDEFAVYERLLSRQALQNHYNAGLASLKHAASLPHRQITREEFFELNIRPLLVNKCAGCHSGEALAESSLAMTSRQALIDGGDFGPAIVPERAEDSLLVHAVKRVHKVLHMPPDSSDALSKTEIAALSRWINDGAIWPEDSQKPLETNPAQKGQRSLPLKVDAVHDWGLLPRRVVAPPPGASDRWTKSGIDCFLESKRRQLGVTATARANRRVLIRRATFDLSGLPPTQGEVSQFLTDSANDDVAFAKVIDRLLASTHYGERVGRLWLDVARYADTQGDVGDIPIQKAYLYRNWVIDSLNADLPFDQFLQAQIAGDILAREVSDEIVARGLTIATGFIAMSRRFGNTKRDDMHLTIEDTIDTLGRGVLGLTLRCARCHDHKFDPILNSDYYGLYGIFESTVYPWMGMSNEKSPSALSPALPRPGAQAQSKAYWDLITRYEYQINNHHRPWLQPTLTEFRTHTKTLHALTAAGQKVNSNERLALKARQLELLKFRGGRFRELMLHSLDWIKSEKQRLAENPPVEFVFAVSEGKPRDARLHRRGNPRLQGASVPRRFLQVLDGATPPTIVGGSGRLELARWLTRPDHPLTARVIVNRVWQQHFGRGIVATSDNFGRQGTKPTHPELLDWLSNNFVSDGWSLKRLHRRIMLSESYQLSATTSPQLQSTDPENTLIVRQQTRRLDAEAIRDSMLAVSGVLDLSQGEAHPIPPWYRNRFNLNNPFHLEPESNRRSVYLLTQRLFGHSILDQFDAPDRNSSTAVRGTSNIPGQALFLMNSPFVAQQAHALAIQLIAAGRSDSERIKILFQRAFARDPEPDEFADLSLFLRRYRDANGESTASPPVEYVAMSRAILTSNEFFFID